ncbi:hypothetical protein CLU79DRAFT_718116 [Phycomyces nitens]|nr:hypothetical protein CLU79DRAFT_718116 [Phycomyces nitens]
MGGTELPQATWAGSAVYSPAFGSVIVIGGQEYSGTTNVPVAMNDIIVINPTTGSYTKWNQTISTTGTLPATRWGHSTVMDANNTNAIMFGGCNDNREAMNDVWLYNINNRAWSPQKTTGTPPSARCRHSAIVIGKYMFVLFGGRNGVFGPDLNVALDINTWTWTTAPVFGTPPVSSASPSASSTHSSSVSKPSSSQTSTGGTEVKESSGISGGAIAGIVVGSIAGVGIIGALLFFFVFKKRNRYSNTNDHGDEEFPKGGVATNGMNTDKYPQGEYGRTPKFEDNATKPDNIIGGPALAPGRIMLEPVKPDGE